MRAGRLRNKVSIWNPTYTNDGDGNFSEATWSKVADAWASIEDISASESSIDGSHSYVASKRFRIRFTSLINSNSIIEYNGHRYWVMDYLDLDGGGTELVVMASEKKAGA